MQPPERRSHCRSTMGTSRRPSAVARFARFIEEKRVEMVASRKAQASRLADAQERPDPMLGWHSLISVACD
jgi:hypothetical protein